MVLNLFDLLGPNATPPGATPLGTVTAAWTYTGVTNPYPAAPVAYDDDVDFNGFASGPYEYTYTVTLNGEDEASTVTVNLNNYAPLPNDECTGALTIAFPAETGAREELNNQNTAGTCPGYGPATASAEAEPVGWGAGPFSGDLWYKFNVPAGTSGADMIFTVTGLPYGAAGGTDFYLALYSGNCAALVEEDIGIPASLGNPTSYILNYVISNAGPGTVTYWLRIANLSGSEGKFNITLSRN